MTPNLVLLVHTFNARDGNYVATTAWQQHLLYQRVLLRGDAQFDRYFFFGRL